MVLVLIGYLSFYFDIENFTDRARLLTPRKFREGPHLIPHRRHNEVPHLKLHRE